MITIQRALGRGKSGHHDRFTPPPVAQLLAVTEHASQLFRLGQTVGTQFTPKWTKIT